MQQQKQLMRRNVCVPVRVCPHKLRLRTHYTNSNYYISTFLIVIAVLSVISTTADGEIINCDDGKLSHVVDGDPDPDVPQCTLETLTTNSSAYEVHCLDADTVRIVGDYQVIRIRCNASFPLDLEYDGFQPTEAIQVYFSKEIEPNSGRRLVAYKFDVLIRSVNALDEFYAQTWKPTATASGRRRSGVKGKENEPQHRIPKVKTSRTGRYSIHDVFNRTRARELYLFLEDEPQSTSSPAVVASLMRNRYCTTILPTEVDNRSNDDPNASRVIIPCRPSHLHANLSLHVEWFDNETLHRAKLMPDGQRVVYSPKIGFTLIGFEHLESTRQFTCEINDLASGSKVNDLVDPEDDEQGSTTETVATSLRFLHPPDEARPQFGFEGLPIGSIQENINIHPQVEIVDSYSFKISLDCIVDNPVDAVLSVIEARTPSHSRLVQEFVFPNYINGSYSGVLGVKSSPPGVLTLKNVGMAGLVFCMSRRITSNETDYKVLEYATGFDKKIRFFKYGQDWSYFDVTESPAVNHLQILPGMLLLVGQSGSEIDNSTSATGPPHFYYVNQTYIFRTRVRIHGLAPPVIWYHELENGTVSEEFIDYDLSDDNFSHFNLTITNETKRVYAAASFWDRQLWKNVSLPIWQGRKIGQGPRVTNGELNVPFLYGASNQVLKCEAAGDPLPDLSWVKDGRTLARENHTSSLILEFYTVGYEDAGAYQCRASSILGTDSKSFSVKVSEEEKPNYWLSIGAPSIVFGLATIGTWVYFRFIRKENVGLTAKEIEAFEQGSPEFTKEMEHMVPENALNIPYNREYEIDEKNFQIATAEVLGSGQFGVVYKGIVDGRTVAVKTVKDGAGKDYLKALLSELKIMCYLGKHPHLVELIGANTAKLKKGSVYLFVELCAEGSLESHLRKNRAHFIPDSDYKNTQLPTASYVPHPNSFNTQQLYVWSYQICRAMEYLVTKKVIHGDLATRNVLLAHGGLAKVTDFGLSRQLYNYEQYVKQNQEPLPWRWMAVESLRDLVFSAHSDAWSFGVTLWEIFTLAEVPYPGLSWDIGFIQQLEHGLRMLRPRYGTQKLYEELLLPCWHTDPECRPSFESMSQYLLNLINIKPLPPHYIRHSDLLTNGQVAVSMYSNSN